MDTLRRKHSWTHRYRPADTCIHGHKVVDAHTQGHTFRHTDTWTHLDANIHGHTVMSTDAFRRTHSWTHRHTDTH